MKNAVIMILAVIVGWLFLSSRKAATTPAVIPGASSGGTDWSAAVSGIASALAGIAHDVIGAAGSAGNDNDGAVTEDGYRVTEF